MEALQQRGSTDAVDAIWPQLGHADRFIRYAARVALEHQDPLLWQDRVLAEKNPQTLITATVALARQGDPKLQPKLLDALQGLDVAKLSETQQLELLRAYALVFIRMGQPDVAAAAKIAAGLDPFYPAKSTPLNRELSRVLAYLNSPTVIDKTLTLMEKEYTPEPEEMAELLARNAGYGGTIARMLANQPEIEKIHFALVLRTMRYGWTLEQRKKYFAWLDAAAQKSGGASYQGFINNIRTEALANASDAEKQALAATSPPPKPVELPKPKGPGRNWDLSLIEELTQDGLSGRSFENGKQTFAAARCVVCHRFDGNGGATGPDLTNAAGRFSYRDLADALIEPSRIISDQYRAALIETTKGEVVTGRIVGENDGNLTVMTDPEDATKIVEIPLGEIAEVEPSKVSLMPRELLNVLSQDEMLDLIAYLMSRGNPDDPMFAK
jgi:putative heme-binding domain-containing protein